MNNKNNRSIEEKYAIVIEGIKGTSSVTDICRKYSLSQSVYYKWRDKFLEGGKKALQNNSSVSESGKESAKVEQLENIIGKQAIEILILKKNLNLV